MEFFWKLLWLLGKNAPKYVVYIRKQSGSYIVCSPGFSLSRSHEAIFFF